VANDSAPSYAQAALDSAHAQAIDAGQFLLGYLIDHEPAGTPVPKFTLFNL
jgi:hypothetical protein